MDPTKSLPPSKPKVFVSLSTVVLLCLFCLLGAGAFAWWAYQSRFTDQARFELERSALSNEMHRAEMQRLRTAEDGRVALAKTRQAEALLKIQSATNLLGRLFTDSSSIST